MALETTDPFTLIYQRIWSKLTTYTPWTDVVTGAQLHFDNQVSQPLLDMAITPAKAPAVMLMQSEFPIEPFHFDASASDMTLHFPLVILGDSLNTAPVNKIKWQTLRAIVNAGIYLGLPRLVRKVSIRGARDDLLNPSQWKAGHQRVMSMLTITVNATIPNDQVLAGSYAATL